MGSIGLTLKGTQRVFVCCKDEGNKRRRDELREVTIKVPDPYPAIIVVIFWEKWSTLAYAIAPKH